MLKQRAAGSVYVICNLDDVVLFDFVLTTKTLEKSSVTIDVLSITINRNVSMKNFCFFIFY